MRIYFILTAILCITALTVPFITNTAIGKNHSAEEITTLSETVESSTEEKKETISVLKSVSGKVTDVDMLEYTIGCVAGEMPASFNEEALKAQAVACFSYAKYILENSDKDNISAHDITDTTLHQCYIDKEQQKEKWGDSYDEYRSKIEKAVKKVYGEILTYNGKPAMTVFHASSPDNNNSSEEIWGKAVPYLVSVSAPSQKTDKTDCSFTSDEFKKLFTEKGKVKLTDSDPKKWARVAAKSEKGFIKSLQVGEKSFSVIEVKDILSLPGVSFTARLDNDIFTFTVNGKGHGVGMSQTSAEYLANEGKTYKDILYHFYPGTTLIK